MNSKLVKVKRLLPIYTKKKTQAKEQYFSSSKEKKWLLSISLSSSYVVHWLSVSSFHLSSPLRHTHSLTALGNIVIIKAKEYLWVLTPSISPYPLWPAIISHTHPWTFTHIRNTHADTYSIHTNKHAHTSISSCDWITFWLIVLLRAKQW